MAQLLTFNEELYPTLAKAKVEDIAGALLYYVLWSRNAWHSTRVTQYTAGCMHTTLETAKEHAEEMRTQGSVFKINEMPAVLLRSQAGCVAITQINTKNPLAGYSATAATDSVGPNMRKIDGALDNYIARDAPMLGAVLSFRPDSRFWTIRPPVENSVVIVMASVPSIEFLSLPNRKLTVTTSVSLGRQYFLGWDVPQVATSPDGVIKVVGVYA